VANFIHAVFMPIRVLSLASIPVDRAFYLRIHAAWSLVGDQHVKGIQVTSVLDQGCTNLKDLQCCITLYNSPLSASLQGQVPNNCP
jgi:hypothetical protein